MPTIFDIGTKPAEKTRSTGVRRTIFDIEEKPRRTIFDIEKKTIPSISPVIEPTIRPTPPKTFIEKVKEIITKPFVRTKEEEIARSQNIYAISKELDLPLATVRKNYNQLNKTLGLRDQPTSPELLGGMLILPITAGLMTHPVTTVIGISGFMGLSEIESAVISKIKGEPYKFLQQKGLKDLLPEEVNQYTSDTVEILDFIGKGLILGGIYKKVPKIAEKFTKNIITEYKMPKRVHISPEKVSSIFKTGEKISPQELELIKDLGLSGKQYKVAGMKGISIEVPAEKIVTIADKPYFSKIKNLFKLKPYEEVRTFRVGKPIEVIPESRLLPAPAKEIIPPAIVGKKTIFDIGKPEIAKPPVVMPTPEVKPTLPSVAPLTEAPVVTPPIPEAEPPKLVEEMPLTPGKIKPLIHRIVGLKKVNDLLKLKKRTYLRQLYRAETKGAEIGYKFGRKELRQAIRDRNEATQLIGKLNSYMKTKLDLDYEDQLHGLLGQYDLTKRQAKTLKEREGTREFIKRMEEEGEMVYIPEDTLKRVDQIPLNDMSLDDLRALQEQAKDIVHFGKLKKQLIARKEIRDIGKVRQKLIKTIRQNFPKAKEEIPEKPLTPSERKPKTLRGRIRKGIAGGFDAYFAMHKKAEAIIESLDGYKELGNVWQEVFNPIAKSEDKETLLGFRLQNIIRRTFERSGIDFVKTSLLQDTIEGSDLTKEEQIGVFVNSLNPDNRDGLRAFGWSDEKINKIVANLTPREKQFGRNLMRLAGAQRYRLFRIGEKLLGRRIKPVKGYWPKVYDYELNEAIALKERESDLFKDVIAKAYVERGFLKSRVKVKRPISLEIFKVFADHMDKTTHFITHALEIRDVQKLIYDPNIKTEIMRAVGKEEYKQLPAWLKYVANPTITSFNWFDKAAGRLRHNTTAAMLGIKVAVGLKQGGSFTMTINRIGVKNAVKGLIAFWKNPIKAQEFIYEKSPSMKFRRNKFDRELKDYLEKLGDKWGTRNKRRFFFTIITNVDKITTLPSWLGAYTKGMNKYKGDEKSGILYADMIARRTQPAASPKDLPAIQRGTNMHKIFTMFYTHFTNVYNETARTTGMLTKKKIGIHEAVVSYWWLLIAPAIYSMYVSKPSNLRRLAKGEYEEITKNTLKAIIGYGFAAFPIIGTAVNSMLNPKYDYLPSPAFALPDEIIKVSKRKKLATKAKAATKAIGYLFGLPTPQMIITGTGIYDLLKGETSNPFRLFLSKWALEDEEGRIRKLPKIEKIRK